MATDTRSQLLTTIGCGRRPATYRMCWGTTKLKLGSGLRFAIPDFTFDYDAAGNRTSMNDGLGSASYGNDELSRLTSETRTFNGLGSYSLNYSYNLAGELTSIANTWNSQVGYGYDTNGRLTNISGSGSASVSNYASGISYRAWGAIKGLNYGNGHALSTAYDSRLRPRPGTCPGCWVTTTITMVITVSTRAA